MRKPKITVAGVDWLMQEWDFEANSAAGIFPDLLGAQSNSYAFWKCRYGHTWKAKINNRYNGRGCPECKKALKTSFPEQAVFFYIKRVFPDAINAYNECFFNGMELDVFIPSILLGIEYDGIAWHKDKSLDNERKKYLICRENKIRLIRLKENKNHILEEREVADEIISVQTPFTSSKRSYPALDSSIKELFSAIKLVYSETGIMTAEAPEQNNQSNPDLIWKLDVNSFRDRAFIFENYLATKENNSLGSRFPEVAALWHPTKNGDLTPFMFSPNSYVQVWWKGQCGHEWDSRITVMTRGAGCPYCHGQRVLKGFNDLETKFPDIAKQWHPTENGTETPDMFTFGSGHRAFWLCPECHQTWRSAINNRTTNGHGCPYCAHERPIKGVNDLPTLMPELMKEWDYDKNAGIDPSDFLSFSNKKVWWKCSKCGYEYQTLINNRTQGTGCKRCAGQVLIPGENDLESTNPDIAAEWDYEENNGVLPSQVFANSNKTYAWKCSNGHKWKASPGTRTRGCGCPYCAGNKVWPGFNDIATTNPEIAAEWHPTKNGTLLPTQVSKGYIKKVWFLCPVCQNAYESYIGNKIKGFGKCPYCSKRKTRARVVYQVETGLSFATLKEAARSVDKEDYRLIQMCCVGKCKTAFGYHWEYRDKKLQENDQ
jgi:DNA-directed RNA polymerase subunit RPC12/RpoP